MTDQLLPGIDYDATKLLQRQMAKKGIKLHFGWEVTKAYTEADEAVCELSSGDKLSAEKAVIAVGRKLNSEGIGLEQIGVETENEAVVVDEHMQTSLAGTYAVGDVVNKGLLAHIAHHQGMVAAENAAGGCSTMDYGAIPFCVYTVPEIASVGLSREQAKERTHEVKVGRFPFSALGKAVLEGSTDGFAQLVADAGTGEILGAQIVGLDATNLISEAVALIKGEITLDELCDAIHPHPTLPEALMEAALDAKGQGIHILSSRSKR
jgi:dihydrolipoamide dehydrogenase